MIRPSVRSLALLALAIVPVACGVPTSGGGAGTAGSDSSAAPVAPSGGTAGCPTSQPAPLAAGSTRTVTITTDLGPIAIEIDADLSPIATGNFVALAECGFYDGVVFHRVVPGFVIQGGDGEFGRAPNLDPDRIGSGGPGYDIQDEPVTATYVRGVLAMARSSQPNSQGSQFFIILDDSAAFSLTQTNDYAILGSVSTGMETVDAIAAAADQEIPTNPVVMTDVAVSTP